MVKKIIVVVGIDGGSVGKQAMAVFIAALISCSFFGLILTADVYAQIEGLKFYGDGRARIELDDRKNFVDTDDDGVKDTYRDEERDRFRYRLRAGFTCTPNSYLELGGRLTSGDTSDANSSHVILGSHNNSDKGTAGLSRDSISIDKAYIKGKYMDAFAWYGKNSMPLWKQNEYFWDDDINPEGIAAGYNFKNVGPLTITLQVGYFVIDEGGWAASGDPDINLITYQAVVKGGVDPVDLVVSYGVVSIDADSTDKILRFQNSIEAVKRDYSVASLQAKVKAIPDIPVTVGYDLMKSDADDKDSGGVISLSGSYKDFSAALLLPDIETNAVSPFAQDDFPNYYSNFKGYEARVGYKIAKNINVDLRRFDAERKTDSKQTEERTQVNFNISF